MFLFFASMFFYKQLMLMLVGLTAGYCCRSQVALSAWGKIRPGYVNEKVFDQNRSLLATGYRLSRKFDMELSYMLRAVKEASNRVTGESIVQVTTFARI